MRKLKNIFFNVLINLVAIFISTKCELLKKQATRTGYKINEEIKKKRSEQLTTFFVRLANVFFFFFCLDWHFFEIKIATRLIKKLKNKKF